MRAWDRVSLDKQEDQTLAVSLDGLNDGKDEERVSRDSRGGAAGLCSWSPSGLLMKTWGYSVEE